MQLLSELLIEGTNLVCVMNPICGFSSILKYKFSLRDSKSTAPMFVGKIFVNTNSSLN